MVIDALAGLKEDIYYDTECNNFVEHVLTT